MQTRFLIYALVGVLDVCAGIGVHIRPDANGQFTYSDDFETNKYASDVVAAVPPSDRWTKGQITNRGPHNTQLIYRYFGDVTVTDIAVDAKASGNGGFLGGYTRLRVSTDGINWILADQTSRFETSRHGWQEGILSVPPEIAAQVTGGTEVWVFVDLANISGLPSNPSNNCQQLDVRIETAAPAPDDPAVVWQQLEQVGPVATVEPGAHLDGTPLFTYEDAWLYHPANAPLTIAESADGFSLEQPYVDRHTMRAPIALSMWCTVADPQSTVMAEITVAAHPASSRAMEVLWNGQPLRTLDTRYGISFDRVFHVPLPAIADGNNELRLAGLDMAPLIIRKVRLAADSDVIFIPKPILPEAEGQSSFFMPPGDKSEIRNPKSEIELAPLAPVGVAVAGPIFEDVTAEVGFEVAEISWGDYNNDGWVDAYMSGSVWRNDEGTRFTKVHTELSGGKGVWGDFDNDGFLDLYAPNGHKLFWNDKGKGFRNVTRMLPGVGEHYSLGGRWGDFNGDGFLDIYLVGWETSQPARAFPDYLFLSQAGRSFTGHWRSGRQQGRGATAADFDMDGDLDVYVSNYRLQPNRLWQNQGGEGNESPRFRNAATELGVAGDGSDGAYGHTIGSVFGDLDNDGFIDLFVGNFSHPPMYQDRPQFLQNRGPGEGWRFEIRSDTGLQWQESFASPTLGDYDNDGDLDLYFTCVYNGDHNVLYRNDGQWKFVNVTNASTISDANTVVGAWADYDNDGDLDLATAGRLYRNRGNAGHRLKVRLVGGHGIARTAIGAIVRIWLDDTTAIMRQVESATGEGNQSDLTIHFGLGEISGELHTEIIWPGGDLQTLTLPADYFATIYYHPDNVERNHPRQVTEVKRPPRIATTLAPDETGKLVYNEDFMTEGFREFGPFSTHADYGGWKPGHLWLGMEGGRPVGSTLVQRFSSPHELQSLNVEITCWANSRDLGGTVTLGVSPPHQPVRWQKVTKGPTHDGPLQVEIPAHAVKDLHEFDVHIMMNSISGVECGDKPCAGVSNLKILAQ